jgi:hypothetical protein
MKTSKIGLMSLAVSTSPIWRQSQKSCWLSIIMHLLSTWLFTEVSCCFSARLILMWIVTYLNKKGKLCTDYSFLAILFLYLYSKDYVCIWSRVNVTILFAGPPLAEFQGKYVHFMSFMPQSWQPDFQVRTTPAEDSERETLFVAQVNAIPI